MMNTKEIEAKNGEMFVINIDDFGTEISVTSNGDEVGTIGLDRKLGELNRPDYYHIIRLGLDGCSGIGIGRQCLIFHRQCFGAVITAGLSGTDEAEDGSCLVPCDHIPRRSWPLFRAKAILNELIADLARSSSSPQLAAGVIVE